MDLLELAKAGADVLSTREALRYGVVLLLVFLRVVFLVTMTPLFGGQGTPARFRLGVALVLAICLAPVVDRAFLVEPASLDLVVDVAREAVIGLTMAVFVRILFEMIGAVGALIDVARGATMMQMYDPLSRAQQTPLGLFHSVVAITLFFAIDGHHLLIDALAASLEVAPPGTPLPGHFVGGAAVLELVSLFADLFVLVVQMAMPVIVVMLVVDVALGMIDRVAQGVQVFFLGMGLKGFAALTIVFLSIGLVMEDALLESMARMARFIAGR